MAIYTVLEPPLRRREARRGPDRFAFVRDGFHFWAFLLAPLWMLWHRLWLALIGFVVVTGALQVALHMLGVSPAGRLLAYALVALLISLEAGTLRRGTLRRRGWREAGIVSGDTREAAERRFFDLWAGQQTSTPPAASFLAPARASMAARQASRPEIVGLFPQAGGPP